MTDKPFAFISYSRSDSVTVDRLSEELNKSGIRTWRDIEQIQPGSNWGQSIADAVKQARAVIFVASANSLASDFVSLEIQSLARHLGKPVIPVLIDGARVSELPDTLKQYQAINLQADFEQGVNAIVAGLEAFGFAAETQSLPQPRRANRGYVFISYAKEDRHHVRRLVGFFTERSYAFFDYQSRERRFEADFDLELEERIRSAQLMVSVITPNWKKAVWPKKEYLFASKVGTPTFLLQFEDPGPSLLIIDRTTIDCSGAAAIGFEVLDEQLAAKSL